MELSRFKQLLESEMGDVKPLIKEDLKSEILSKLDPQKPKGCNEMKHDISVVLKKAELTPDQKNKKEDDYVAYVCKNINSYVSDIVNVMVPKTNNPQKDKYFKDKYTQCLTEGVSEYCNKRIEDKYK